MNVPLAGGKDSSLNISVMAVLLAAGRSSRMQALKPLLPIRGVPMLEHVISKVLQFPFALCVCVTGFESDRIQQTITVSDPRFQWVHNDDYLSGQSSSLKKAAAFCGETMRGMMVFLADQPFIEKETIGIVLDKASELDPTVNTHLIIQPSYQGTKGHPVYISRDMFGFFTEMHGDAGARTILHHAREHLLLPVEDKSILIDLDTPEDYNRFCYAE